MDAPEVKKLDCYDEFQEWEGSEESGSPPTANQLPTNDRLVLVACKPCFEERKAFQQDWMLHLMIFFLIGGYVTLFSLGLCCS
jgi:hypothetical protein